MKKKTRNSKYLYTILFKLFIIPPFKYIYGSFIILQYNKTYKKIT